MIFQNIIRKSYNNDLQMWWLCTIALTIYTELQIPVLHKDIKDVGFEFTQNMHDYLIAHPKTNTGLSLANSIILMSCNTFYVYDSIINGWTPLVEGFTLLYSFRFIVGFLTRYPQSSELIEDKTEIPPLGSNFFFLFSAHTMSIYLVGAHLATNILEMCLLGIIIVLQGIRLLATRGHYSSDIIVALGLSHLTHIVTHQC